MINPGFYRFWVEIDPRGMHIFVPIVEQQLTDVDILLLDEEEPLRYYCQIGSRPSSRPSI